MAAGIAIIYLFPRLTRAIPAALVAIIVLTAVAMMMSLPVRWLGDAGTIPSTLPFLSVPHVPFTLQTLTIIFPVAFAIAIVGLLESLLTAQIVDDLTMSRSNKHRETGGLGIANIVAGFFGGMAGCAMIGQSVINVTAGGRGRFSRFRWVLLRCPKAVRCERSAASLSCLFQGLEPSNRSKTLGSTRLT